MHRGRNGVIHDVGVKKFKETIKTFFIRDLLTS